MSIYRIKSLFSNQSVQLNDIVIIFLYHTHVGTVVMMMFLYVKTKISIAA